MLSATTLSESEKASNVCSVGSGEEKAPKCCSSGADLNGALAIGRGWLLPEGGRVGTGGRFLVVLDS